MNTSEYRETLRHLSTDELADMLAHRIEVRRRRAATLKGGPTPSAYSFSIKCIEEELAGRQMVLDLQRDLGGR